MAPKKPVRRCLLAEFNAVAPPDVDVELPAEGENRANLVAEQLLNADVEQFKTKWGYDPVADRVVEGSNWEYEQIYPVVSSQGLVPAQGGEVPVEGEGMNAGQEEGGEVQGEHPANQ